MVKQKIYSLFILTVFLTTSYAQKSVNQFDKDGKRHGKWTKNYHKTDQKRYEGTFVHGKEVDSFKFYTLSSGKSVLSAVKVFNEHDSIADVTFFASTKKVISKGKMNGKRFTGDWVFYHKNSSDIMIKEHYNDAGLLEGERIVYFKTGKVAERANYKNGELHGESKWYSEQNVLLRHANYIEGQLEGKTIHYNSEGQVVSEGDYKDNKKDGIWKYYKAGQLNKKIDHTTEEIIYKKE
ncbi:toxin-antitoxin system YwqK family antitoxin [Winogradskyella eckloniae]|uniref:toxin-antitoxin system YwqK family antitoxin n=1 Tax=Winogradskyella eckloniae TaxID=1089306 RepID=UPI001564A196|nr:toxin-antitoxin system YwqK family antitoxin [Winogradskyella eckloniae]NRD19876.1 toxin-antitoxin system YwqK family antitoxin [Winogradskyella eckloniae]